MISWRRNCNPLQYSCLENSTDRGAWWVTPHGAKESDRTNTFHFHSGKEHTGWGHSPSNSGKNKIPMADVWQKPLQYCNNPPIKKNNKIAIRLNLRQVNPEGAALQSPKDPAGTATGKQRGCNAATPWHTCRTLPEKPGSLFPCFFSSLLGILYPESPELGPPLHTRNLQSDPIVLAPFLSPISMLVALNCPSC